MISADGFIVTNNHVIEGADDIEIDFFNGKRLRAKLVGTDLKTDIALLKVESETPLPFVTFGAARFGPEGGYLGLIMGAALFGILAVIAAYRVTGRLAKRRMVL